VVVLKLVVVGMVAAAPMALASTAAAQASAPSGSWKIAHTHVTAGSSDRVSYSVRNAPRHGSVVLEQRHGGGWRVTDTLDARTHAGKSASGHVVVTMPPRGEYQFRVLVRDSAKHAVLTLATRTVFSYDAVPLARIAGGDAGHVRVHGQRFDYVGSGTAGLNRSLNTSTCRSIKLVGAFEDQAAANSNGTITVKRHKARLGSLTVPAPGKLYSTNIALSAGEFDIILKTKTSDAVFYNGTLACWTRSGL
jgi:hypothetical protein